MKTNTKRTKKEFRNGQIVYVIKSHCTDYDAWDAEVWYGYEEMSINKPAYNNRGKRNGFWYLYTNPKEGWDKKKWKYVPEELIYGTEEEAREATKRMYVEYKKEVEEMKEEQRKADEELKEVTEEVLKDIGADEDTAEYIRGRMIAFCGVKYEYENVRRTIEGCIKRRNERKVHENEYKVHSESGIDAV